MLKKTNSILSFICSFVTIAIVLDYLLWPRVIKANESTEQGIQIKIIAGVVLLLLSLYFRKEAKENEIQNRWLKASGVINFIVLSIFILSILFYVYTELTK